MKRRQDLCADNPSLYFLGRWIGRADREAARASVVYAAGGRRLHAVWRCAAKPWRLCAGCDAQRTAFMPSERMRASILRVSSRCSCKKSTESGPPHRCTHKPLHGRRRRICYAECRARTGRGTASRAHDGLHAGGQRIVLSMLEYSESPQLDSAHSLAGGPTPEYSLELSPTWRLPIRCHARNAGPLK